MKNKQSLLIRLRNSYRLNAIVETIYFPQDIDDARTLIQIIGKRKFIFIGGGNNIILSKTYYRDEVFIFLDKFEHNVELSENGLIVGAGVSLRNAAEIALSESLSGLEVFWDIPGTFGGALHMNAGAYGEEILKLALWVDIMNFETGEITRLHQKQISPFYRGSNLKDPRFLIVRVELQMSQGIPEEISKKMVNLSNLRRQKFPYEYPNAGSIFKKPPMGMSTGMMIEELGLKGLRYGGAQISSKHAGFIINTGMATGKDIICLAQIIQEKVLDKFNVHLEFEQVIV